MDDLSSFQNNGQQQLNPWSKRKEAGWLKAMWRTVKILLVRPQMFFKDFPPSGSIKEAYLFYLIAAISFTILFLLVIPCLSCLFFSKYLIFLTIFAILGSLVVPFLWAGLFHLFIKLCGGKNTYAATFQVTCYSFGATIVFSLIPYIGLTLTMFWSVFILIVGCSRVHRISAVRAAVALFIAMSVLPLIKLGQQYQIKNLKARINQASEYLRENTPAPVPQQPFTIELADFPCLTELAPNLQCVEQAAQNEEPRAQYLLGVFYSNGIGVGLNLRTAEKWFRKAAEQGFVQAQYKLGRFYINGAGRLGIKEAAQWDLVAAEGGAPQAQYVLAGYYRYGIAGFPRNYTKAEQWHRKAAEQGYSWAQYDLGRLYSDGKGIPPDYNEALKWFQKSAAQDNPDTFCYLGFMYEVGEGVPQNIVEAIKWYEKAAGYDEEFDAAPYAQERLGLHYEFNEKNYQEAEKWYRKAAQGHKALAQYHLARIYDLGLGGVPKDYAAAGELGRKAAEGGYPEAQFSLGWVYAGGHVASVPQDLEKAYFWMNTSVRGGYKRAAEELKKIAKKLSWKQIIAAKIRVLRWKPKTVVEQIIEEDPVDADIPTFNATVVDLVDFCFGATTPSERCLDQAAQGDARVQYFLGVLYDHGVGVGQDYKEAKKWYRKAASQGFALAQYNFSVLCSAGLTNYEDSTKWYYKAAKQGFAPAQLVMGRRYDYGVAGLSENPGEAEKWYRRAAEQGLVPAQLNLGGLLLHSLDSRRRQEGRYWVERAANQGNTNAQLLLGHLYQNGRGGSKDWDKTYFWLSLALKDPEIKGWEKKYASTVHRLISFLIPRKRIVEFDVQVHDWKPREE